MHIQVSISSYVTILSSLLYSPKVSVKSLMLDIIQTGNQTLLTASNNPLNITQDWFEPNYWYRKKAIITEKKGRSTTWFFTYEEGTAVLRHYWRGGLIGKLLSDQYLYTGLKNTRTYQEYNLLIELANKGLNVPVPIAAKIATNGFICRGDLITKAIPGARSLLDILKSRPLDDDEVMQVGQAIAKFHQQGVYHADLNINNILFDNHNNVFLIDFDRGRIVKPSSTRLQANIDRLHRSFEKEQNRNNPCYWQPKQWQLLLNEYQDKRAAKVS